MAASTQESLERVERRRAELQENVDKLQKALDHWSTLGVEYEMLKEEIQHAKDPSPSEMLEIGRSLGGSLVNEKEIEELLGKDPQSKRNANQVVDLLSRRIDYVQQNISTVEKQLNSTEKKLAGADLLLEPGVENEEGLPMMDIEEELDEHGNEISSSVSQTGKAAAEIVEVLRRAGIQKTELEKATNSNKPTEESHSSITPAPLRDASNTEPSPVSAEPGSITTQKATSKKSVSFSDDTKPDQSAKHLSKLEESGYNDDLDNFNFTRGTKVVELDDDDNEIASYPIIPQDETPEAAALRRQMLQYGLSEVGQVVAELDLDHPTVEYSDDDIDDEEYGSDEDSEDEDQYGRSTRPVLTEDYKRQMMDLEKKLNARMMENVGPRPDTHPLAEHADDVRTLRVRKDVEFDDSMDTSEDAPKEVKPKKGVRFANELDISDVPQPTREPLEALRSPSISKPTMSETIVERSVPPSQPPDASSKSAKVSRFKSSRASSNQPGSSILPSPPVPEPSRLPTGPAGRTLANTVVEHTPQSSEPQAPDEFDPILLNREIQTEYHKMRNKLIQKQGGFMPTEEDKEDPIMEEKDGKAKKVSRFKAARLKAEGL